MAEKTPPEGRGASGAVLVPDFDELPVAALQNRIRSLTTGELEQLLAHERQHAHRPAVEGLIRSRIGQLEGGAQPSGGSPQTPAPARPPAPEGDSKAPPDTAGPPLDPPSHGVPANPAQPR